MGIHFGFGFFSGLADQLKVSRVPFHIGYCHIYLELGGSLKVTFTVPLIVFAKSETHVISKSSIPSE